MPARGKAYTGTPILEGGGWKDRVEGQRVAGKATGRTYGTKARAGAGGAFTDQALGERATGRQPAGALQAPETYRDASFYAKKRAKEAELGRELTMAEFRDQFWTGGVSPAGLTIGQIEMENPTSSGTSIFDPVLCEIAYRWWCPPGGLILDPFAGGSVRGVVASHLGRRYVGVELRGEQVAANEAQRDICRDPMPEWRQGDSRRIAEICADLDEADFVFSCPPYADLEVYSDDEADLSAMDWPEFRDAYAEIIAAACAKLREDRFACFVVGDARGRDGCYYGLPEFTVQAFEAAGLRKYNEAILITAAGSLPIRVGRQFEATRKLGKTHQNVLTFVKGDGKRATEAIGPVEFGEIAADENGEAAPPIEGAPPGEDDPHADLGEPL